MGLYSYLHKKYPQDVISIENLRDEILDQKFTSKNIFFTLDEAIEIIEKY